MATPSSPSCVPLPRPARAVAALLAGAVALFHAGCTSTHHRKSADKEVYRIIEQVENSVFHRTNAFTIDTAYSRRDPTEIPPSELIGDRLQAGQRVMSIEEALDLAVRGSRRYQTEKERLYLTALTLTGQRYEFGPQFFAGGAGSINRDASGDYFLSTEAQLSVSQLLKTGGRLSASLINDLFRYYTGDPQKSIVTLASINLVQPLLRGFGRDNPAVERLTQAERDVVYAMRNFGFFQQQFAVEIVNDYFDLLAQKDIIRNRYTNYLSRAQSTERLEARANDRESLSDVDQARQAELTARNNYVNAVAAYRNTLDQFKIKLGLPIGDRVVLEDDALVELEQAGLVELSLNPTLAYRVAVEKQLQLLNAIDSFEDSKRKIRVAASQLRAGLDLFANARLQSEPPTDYTKFDIDTVTGGIGLELDLPLDRLRERNTYRATLIAFESEIRSLTLALDTLRENIDRGLRTLEQRRENYDIQVNAFKLADRRVTSTTLLLQAGRAEVRDLVEAQDAQIAAQNAVTAARVEYHEVRLQLLLNIGALDTSVPRFWLKDQMASFLPQGTPMATQPAAPDGGARVIPPDDFFNN